MNRRPLNPTACALRRLFAVPVLLLAAWHGLLDYLTDPRCWRDAGATCRRAGLACAAAWRYARLTTRLTEHEASNVAARACAAVEAAARRAFDAVDRFDPLALPLREGPGAGRPDWRRVDLTPPARRAA